MFIISIIDLFLFLTIYSSVNKIGDRGAIALADVLPHTRVTSILLDGLAFRNDMHLQALLIVLYYEYIHR